MHCRAAVSDLKLLLSPPAVVQLLSALGSAPSALLCALWPSNIVSANYLCPERLTAQNLGHAAMLCLCLLKTTSVSFEKTMLQSYTADTLLWVCAVPAILAH